jgi:hypothetical protein
MLVMRRLFLIDGVAVPRVIYARRQEFLEYKGANFRTVEIPSQKQSDLRKRATKARQYHEPTTGEEKYNVS